MQVQLYPEWLQVLSWVSLITAFICSAILLLDELRDPQEMTVMNFVWPITALYFGPIAVWAYYRVASRTTKQHMQRIKASRGSDMKHKKVELKHQPATRTQIAVAVSHCGAGCTLGDIAGEWLIYATGLSFAGGVFQTRLLIDFVLAWSFGIVYQYFTIVPMRGLSVGKGILAAIKADTISIVAFQIGMSIWMALTYYVFFTSPHLKTNEAESWFMMQIAMVVGYFTSYPANAWLLKKGLKEKMPDMPDAVHQLDRLAV
jgi:hypothetical protein